MKQERAYTLITGKGCKFCDVQTIEAMEDETLGVGMPCRMSNWRSRRYRNLGWDLGLERDESFG